MVNGEAHLLRTAVCTTVVARRFGHTCIENMTIEQLQRFAHHLHEFGFPGKCGDCTIRTTLSGLELLKAMHTCILTELTVASVIWRSETTLGSSTSNIHVIVNDSRRRNYRHLPTIPPSSR